MKLDIPVPTIKDVATYEKDIPATYEAPTAYVRYERPKLEETDTIIEYNLDEEDENWLLEHPIFGSKTLSSQETLSVEKTDATEAPENSLNGLDNIPEEPKENNCLNNDEHRVKLPLRTFEHMINLLEKATAFETIITLVQAERLIVAKIPEILDSFGSAHTGPLHTQEHKKGKGIVNCKTVVTEVYNYWVNKRSKLKKPLLRRYWPVTATNDTNPHMVFRPREKEKYKLRKKRQNDLDGYKKMKQLRIDFTKIKALLDLIKKREELNKVVLDMQCDWFDQRLYEMIDTSGLQRESDRLSHKEVDEAMDVPKLFDTHGLDKGKKKKRKRSSLAKSPKVPLTGKSAVSNASSNSAVEMDSAHRASAKKPRAIPADQNNPPPCLNPLRTREHYITSWKNAVPFITTYVDAKPIETCRFRHRPRIGRGGRVIIDRIPHPTHGDQPTNVYVSGEGTAMECEEGKQVGRMLELLPQALDTNEVRRRIEEISANAMIEEDERNKKTKGLSLPSSTSNNSAANNDDGNDVEAVLVKMNDWTETDEQIFGGLENGLTFGPL